MRDWPLGFKGAVMRNWRATLQPSISLIYKGILQATPLKFITKQKLHCFIERFTGRRYICGRPVSRTLPA